MKFTLEIECDNDAFQDGNIGLEVATVLRGIADRAEKVDPCSPWLFVPAGAYDSNGNSCASFKFVQEA